MLDLIRNQWDRFRGTGAYSIYSPNLDGPFRHNSVLDGARVLSTAPAPGNLAVLGGEVVFTSGRELRNIKGELISSYSANVSCLAVSPAGRVLAGLAEGGVTLGAESNVMGADELTCPVAAVFEDEDHVLVANGSAVNRVKDWVRDLMLKGRSGSIWRIDLASSRMELLAGEFEWPAALKLEANGDILVAECWRHRLVYLNGFTGKKTVKFHGLPGYPNAMTATPDGGFWLSFLSIRNQLIEFVLTEKHFVERMVAMVPQEFWIAPAYKSGESFKEPIQGSGIKHMGILKPWAATRSYGLIARFDHNAHPCESLHSRVNGRFHGICSILILEGELYFASRGAEQIALLCEGGMA